MKSIVLCGLILCFAFIGVVSANSLTFEKYTEKEELEIIDQLRTMEFKEFMEDFEQFSHIATQTGDINVLIPFISEAVNRKGQLSNELILENVRDSEKLLFYKKAMLELYFEKNSDFINSNNDAVYELLKDSFLEESLKYQIISFSNFTLKDVELLTSIVNEEDGILSFIAMKRLSLIDDKAAYDLSKSILQNRSDFSSHKVSAAIKATSNYIKNNKYDVNSEVIEEFIKLNYEVMNTSKDDVLNDSAFFAISNTRTEESISRIVNDDSIDRELKVFAIDQNYYILNEMLLNDPSVENITTVVKAMEIYPVIELSETLEQIIPNVKDSWLLDSIQKVIKEIEENGVKGNYKWLDNEREVNK